MAQEWNVTKERNFVGIVAQGLFEDAAKHCGFSVIHPHLSFDSLGVDGHVVTHLGAASVFGDFNVEDDRIVFNTCGLTSRQSSASLKVVVAGALAEPGVTTGICSP